MQPVPGRHETFSWGDMRNFFNLLNYFFVFVLENGKGVQKEGRTSYI